MANVDAVDDIVLYLLDVLRAGEYCVEEESSSVINVIIRIINLWDICFLKQGALGRGGVLRIFYYIITQGIFIANFHLVVFTQ